LSLILLVLGTGLGFSAVSPWADRGASAGTLGVSAVVWLAFVQLAASGIGGYVAGRLRTRWLGVEADEVFFRDTAHGFLAWSVATLATAALLTSAIGAVVGTTAQAGASIASGVATTGGAVAGGAAATAAGGGASSPGGVMPDVNRYFVDTLMRRDPSQAASAPAGAGGSGTAGQSGAGPDAGAQSASEVGRIMAHAVREGAMSPDDQKYLAGIVAQRTGIPQADAEKRVTDTFQKLQAQLKSAETSARDAADKARKATAYASLWMFVGLLLGAFVASLSATWGGRQRDR
jgi:hypothetical protein